MADHGLVVEMEEKRGRWSWMDLKRTKGKRLRSSIGRYTRQKKAKEIHTLEDFNATMPRSSGPVPGPDERLAEPIVVKNVCNS